MTMEQTLHQPLRLPFAGGIDVPPPSARAALRVQKVLTAIDKSARTGEEIDLADLTRSMGVADPDSYDMNVDLFGTALHEQLLDTLNVEEFAAAQRAMFLWIAPSGSRKAAERFLADPTRAAANREARRKKKTSGST